MFNLIRSFPVLRWGWVFLLMLTLITAVNLIGLGVQGLGQTTAETLVKWVENPLLGLLVGVLATALVQSSGLIIALLVGLVAGGFPLTLAIPVVMGANIGTTVTNTLVSLGQAKTGSAFERSFAAATVHDFFNLFTVFIFFPLEEWFHPLERFSGQWVQFFANLAHPNQPGLTLPNPFQSTIAPLTQQIAAGFAHWPDPWNHGGVLGSGLLLMLISLPLLSQQLQHLILDQRALQWQTGIPEGEWGSGWSTLGLGILLTALVQSSSATTSVMVPLAGSGVLSLAQIYPFTLGANIGTCITGLLVAISLPPSLMAAGLQIGLIHLFYNCCGVLCFYGIPGLRSLPLRAATQLARLANDRKILAVSWVGLVFFGLPLLLLAWSSPSILGKF